MAQSLSWIDASEIEAQLRRIGVAARANEKPTAKHSLPDMAAKAAEDRAGAAPAASPTAAVEARADEIDPNEVTRPPVGDFEPDYDDITRPPVGSDSTQPLKQADLERAVSVSGLHPVRLPNPPLDGEDDDEEAGSAQASADEPTRDVEQASGPSIAPGAADSEATLPAAPPPTRSTGTQPRWPAQPLGSTGVKRPEVSSTSPEQGDEDVRADAQDDEDELAGPGPDDETPAPHDFRPPGMTASLDESMEELAGPDGGQPVAASPSDDDPIPVARPSVEDGDSSIMRAPTGSDIHEAVSVDGPDAAAKSGVAGSAWSRFPSGKALARIQLRTRSQMVSESDEVAPMVDSSTGAAHGFERSSATSLPRPGGPDPAQPAIRPRANTDELLAVGLSLQERLAALAQLLLDKTSSRGAFIADADGFGLAQVNCSDHEVAVSAALRSVLRPIRDLLDDPEDRSIAMELPGNEYLHVIWVETPRGSLAVGLYCPRLLGADLNPAVRRMLLRVLATDKKGKSAEAADDAE